jgi:hypothetical protein
MIKAIDKWLPGYIRAALARKKPDPTQPTHVFIALMDHFEPLGYRNSLSLETGIETVKHWVERYPDAMAPVKDADGRCPQHTLFYPADQYDPELLKPLERFTANGFGEIEIHLHHRNDTAENLKNTLDNFKNTLHKDHGFLGTDPDGNVRYAFIHGNWSLCNSRPDGDWCGVDQELSILRQTGCYADFTMPSAPSPTQARTVNQVYYAQDNPIGPRGHDHGVPATSGKTLNQSTDHLLLVPGPLAPNWRQRKWGVLPKLENAEITSVNPPTVERLKTWIKAGVGIRGREDWIFVKLHTHGCIPKTRDFLLGGGYAKAMETVCETCHQLNVLPHFVRAREMYNLIRAAEDGGKGDPREFFDYEVAAPLTGNGFETPWYSQVANLRSVTARLENM